MRLIICQGSTTENTEMMIRKQESEIISEVVLFWRRKQGLGCYHRNENIFVVKELISFPSMSFLHISESKHSFLLYNIPSCDHIIIYSLIHYYAASSFSSITHNVTLVKISWQFAILSKRNIFKDIF